MLSVILLVDIVLSVVTLRVIMLCAILLSVVMPNVVAPFQQRSNKNSKTFNPIIYDFLQ
jgi:hypothetical protein